MAKKIQIGKFVKAGVLGFPEGRILEERVLKSGIFVKKIAQTTIVDHRTRGRRVESLTINDYRKKRKTDPWPSPATSRITLDHKAIRELLSYLLSHKEFLKLQRSTQYTLLTGASELSELAPEEIEALVLLIRVAAQKGKLGELVKPEVIKNFNAAIQQARFKSAIDQLRLMLTKDLNEIDYKKWFLVHPWVFGTEYIGTEEEVKAGWRSKGDIILTSVDGYQDFIELKLPKMDVLRYDDSHKNWYPSQNLSKAIAQVLKYIQESEDVRQTIVNKEKLPFLKPRARIVMGRSKNWNQEKLDALRRLNAALQNAQIMTYDHLVASAKRMIEYYEEQAGS